MTVTAPEDQLVDVELSPAERAMAAELARQAHAARSEDEVVKVILGGLVAYSAYVKRAAIASAIGRIRGVAQVNLTAEILMMGYSPYWNSFIAPLFKSFIFFRQVREAKALMPDEMMFALAEDYSKRLHGYFTTTSAEAMTDGFNAYVNRKLPPRVAAEKVFGNFGLTKRQMASAVAQDFAKVEVVTTTRAMDPRRRIKQFVAKALDDRLKGIAEHEAFVISEEAKQVGWLYQMKQGHLPATATKMWMTARDERVCGVCGPMHKQEVPVNEHFVLPSGVKVWTTGVHPKCRCRMRLRLNTVDTFSKADDEYKRDRRGRFAHVDTNDDRLEQAQRDMIQRALDQKTDDGLQVSGLTPVPVAAGNDKIQMDMGINVSATAPEEKIQVGVKGEGPLQVSAGSKQKDTLLDVSAPVESLGEISVRREQMAEVYAEDVADLLVGMESGEGRKVYRASQHNTRPTIVLGGYIYGTPEAGIDWFEHGTDGELRGEMVLLPEDKFAPVMEMDLSNNIELNHKINNRVEDLWDEAPNYSEVIDGVSVHADLENDLDDIVSSAAYGFPLDRESASMGYSEPVIPLQFFDDEGMFVKEQHVRVADIADHIGVHPEQFALRIFRTREVHADAGVVGGSMHAATEFTDVEHWSIAGNYFAESNGIHTTEHGARVEVIDLTPIVDED